MTSNRFFKIVIVALLLINVSIISYLWVSRQSNFPMRPPRPRQEEAFTFLCKQLQLDENQIHQYQKLRDEHHQEIENIQQKTHQLREHFFDLLQHSPVDSIAVKSISDSIANTQEQIELATFYHFRQVRKILRPDQQKHFDEVIQQALRMMAPRPPQEPPPPRE